MTKKLLTISAFALLSGCVSYQPIPEDYNGPLATIQDSSRLKTTSRVHFFELVKVNGRDVVSSTAATASTNRGKGLSMTAMTMDRKVPAEPSTLTLRGNTHVAAPILALGGKMYSVSGDIQVDLNQGETYTVRGQLSKDYSAVWLEDANGNVVSEKIESSE